jgi:hypothetical protein
MYSFGLLIVELETARIRLVDAFEAPDGTTPRGFRTQTISDIPRSIGLLTRLKSPFGTFPVTDLILRNH